ncbi:MAG: Na+/H+ antiporter NhaC family protein [Prevotella sp.]|nr:Na+/H+ antiporter NhaC family protein [Candidatus Equicola stercoris]
MDKKGLLGISPLIVFVLFYLGSALIAGNFTSMPIVVAFMVSVIYAVCITRGLSLPDRVRVFGRGAGTTKIIFMILIFLVAGAFASSAMAMGCIGETVDFILSVLPPQLVYASLFIAGCFISMATGSGIGAIVAVGPIAVGVAEGLGVSMSFMGALVVCSAMFGDNLSFISDTTVVATTTQGCELKDKFRTNIWLVIPASILVVALYIWMGRDVQPVLEEHVVEPLKMLPYLVVLIASVCGVDIFISLLSGTLLCGIEGMIYGDFDFFGWADAMGDGINNMGSLVIMIILASGFMALIKHNGGLEYLVKVCSRFVKGRRSAEFFICLITALMCACTAVNTVAVISISGVVKEISEKFGVAPRRAASLLDTSSCIIQEVIPYSPHLLAAAAFAKISVVTMIPYVYYAYLLAVFVVLSIIFNIPRVKMPTNVLEQAK